MASQRLNVERSRSFTLSRPYLSGDSDTYIDESVNAYDPVRADEVVVVGRIPTSPIASSIAEMSFSNYGDKDGKLDEDIVINDNDFQLQQLQEEVEELKAANSSLEAAVQEYADENEDLKKTSVGYSAQIDNLNGDNDQLKEEIASLLAEREVIRSSNEQLAKENEILREENVELKLVKMVDLKHRIAVLKLRVGDQMKLLSKFTAGLFPQGRHQHRLGFGDVFNGENVYWRKASQALWDESFHGPLFGAGDAHCNFVLLEKCVPSAQDEDQRTLVHAVGCHVTRGTSIKFNMNGEAANFKF